MIAPDGSKTRGTSEAPLAQPMATVGAPEPFTLVIFGATGDLTRRKLLPALFELHCQELLPDRFAIVGFARERLTDEQFRDRMFRALTEFAAEPDPTHWAAFSSRLSYLGSDFQNADCFTHLGELLAAKAELLGTANRLFYLAIPPGVIETVVHALDDADLVLPAQGSEWCRIVVEKPFGRDLKSAKELNALLLRVFDEPQVFRIDHYLGKETVQNLLVFRFANVIWEPIWNRQFVSHVVITVAESVGVEQRAGYYEQSGALRDMLQSHLLQLLTLIAMEPPSSYDAQAIRNEKVKVLCSLRRIDGDAAAQDTARGQYEAGTIAGESVIGYTEEAGVAAGSQTETFAALRLWIDNWRWAGVPFHLRTGKRLPQRETEITLHFRPAPHPILDTVEGDRPAPNRLTLRIQPNEGIVLQFEAKVPGLRGPLKPIAMSFSYDTAFGETVPEAYQRLLLDAMLGDATLFARKDEVEGAWWLVTPILEAWAAGQGPPVEAYEAGTPGPPSAEALLARDAKANEASVPS